MSKGVSWVLGALAVTLALGAVACGGDVIWDFEDGEDHDFELTCVNPAAPAPDNPTVAGDEAITGVPNGLPGAGIAWCIGRPDEFDGMKPAVQEGDKAGADGTLQYNRAGTNHPFAFPTNGRGQESYLNTYNLTQWGDGVHAGANDQIAKSPLVLLGQGALLTVWAYGGGSGTHTPALDPDPAAGYTTGSSGIAVLSESDGSLLASVLTNGLGTLRQNTLDLASYAGRKVRIEVVDAFAGGWGWLAVDEIRITNAAVLVPGRAAAPSPGDGAKDVPFDVTLSWMASELAGTHDVYLGKTFADVNEASRAAPKDVLASEGQTAATYGPAAPLEYGQTYYWRVDEVNKAPDNTIFKGKVWSFAVEPYAYPVKPVKATASSSMASSMGPEKTIDGSGLDAQDQHGVSSTLMWLSKKGQSPVWIQYEFDKVYKLYEMWVWNSNQTVETITGFGAKDVKVETSVDGTTWTALTGVPEFAQASGEPNYVHNTTVGFGGAQAKYVRLTTASNWADGTKQAGLSEVRFFYVPIKAFGSSPAPAATSVAVDATLNWRPGREAAQHEVYLGTDPASLSLAKTVTSHSLGLASLGLQYGKTYYWRVNEVNDAATPAVLEGDVWSFTTSDYLVVDGFDAYNDTCNRVFFAWVDGFGYSASPDCGIAGSSGNGTGSTVGNTNPPFAERTVVHGGIQAMPLAYDNATGKSTSEAIRTFATPRDWTANGIKSLSLWFYGDPANAGQMYVKVNDTKVLYNGAAEDIKRKQWQPWNIDLSTVGAGLNKVTRLTIGVEGAGTMGRLIIDDIRLYPKAPEFVNPVDPGKVGLLAEYLFDNAVSDSSGKGNNGTLLGNAQVSGSYLVLDGLDSAVAIPRLGGANAVFTRCTYSMWIISNRDPAKAGIIGGVNSDNWTTGGVHCKLDAGRANAGINALAGGDMNGKTIVGSNEWVHLALTVSDAVAAIYLNGQMADSRSFTTPLTMYLGNGCIGAWKNNSEIIRELDGKMDDVRIYDRAVSDAEIQWLAGRRTPVQKPF